MQQQSLRPAVPLVPATRDYPGHNTGRPGTLSLAQLETPQGKVQVSYTFKQDGENLTGTWQAAQSPTVHISEGKVTGDRVSFVVKMDAAGGIPFAHEGKINGNGIQPTMKPSGEFPGSNVVAKRMK